MRITNTGPSKMYISISAERSFGCVAVLLPGETFISESEKLFAWTDKDTTTDIITEERG